MTKKSEPFIIILACTILCAVVGGIFYLSLLAVDLRTRDIIHRPVSWVYIEPIGRIEVGTVVPNAGEVTDLWAADGRVKIEFGPHKSKVYSAHELKQITYVGE